MSDVVATLLCYCVFVSAVVCAFLVFLSFCFFFQAEDGIRDAQESRGLGDVYKRQLEDLSPLRALTDLISLDVAGNQLTNIDPLLDLPALGSVNLSLNRLDTDANSAAWNVITNLQARGVTVDYDPQYDAPAPPLITSQPASVVAYLGDNVSFHVEASGSPNYWWLKNGANLCDTERIGGTRDDTLYLDNVQASDTASYRVRIWDEYGVTNSRTVTLRVITQVAFADPRLEQVLRGRSRMARHAPDGAGAPVARRTALGGLPSGFAHPMSGGF